MPAGGAVAARAGPPLPPEFKIPQRVPRPDERKSPLPADWSDSTKDLRGLADAIANLFEKR